MNSLTAERRFWMLFETVHATCYFHPAFQSSLKALGVTGWWNGYFGSRIAPLGPVGPGAAAVFFGFAPAMTARPLTRAWQMATPEAFIAARFTAAEEAITPFVADVPADDLQTTATALEDAVSEGVNSDRVLGHGWAQVSRPDSLVARIWLACTALREHRGDAHTIAVLHAGLTPLEALMTHHSWGAEVSESVQANRGWTADEWSHAREQLISRRILLADGSLSVDGERLRQRVEADTDRLSSRPVESLVRTWPVVTLSLQHLGIRIADAGVLPYPNAMGLPRLK